MTHTYNFIQIILRERERERERERAIFGSL